MRVETLWTSQKHAVNTGLSLAWVNVHDFSIFWVILRLHVHTKTDLWIPALFQHWALLNVANRPNADFGLVVD